ALFLTLILLAGLTVLSMRRAASPGHQPHPAARLVLAVVSPCQEAVTTLSRTFAGIWEQYFALADTARENRELKRQLSLARADQRRCGQLEQENERLKRLLDFSGTTPLPVVAAQVIAGGPSDWYQSVVINRGRDHGVGPGCAVITPEGVAGRVITSSGWYSQVMLITDPNSGVDVRVARTRARGVVEGAVSGVCRMKYAEKKDEIAPGDLLVTSGLDRVYPPGLAVGEVTEVSKSSRALFSDVLVRPVVPFDKLEEVLVVLPGPDAEEGG
ncbi:MAG: rod shape-determining protein MreC, partial [Deltaproteobacteria bacterium]|nr:rod shape-determining protein MreC [Deltaproteobacteria bacterium]